MGSRMHFGSVLGGPWRPNAAKVASQRVTFGDSFLQETENNRFLNINKSMSKTCRQMMSKIVKHDIKSGTEINPKTMRTNYKILTELGRFWKGRIITNPLVSIGFSNFERLRQSFEQMFKIGSTIHQKSLRNRCPKTKRNNVGK